MHTAQQQSFTIGEAASLLGVSSETLRRYDRAGKIAVRRTAGGKRFFTREDVEQIKIYLKKKNGSSQTSYYPQDYTPKSLKSFPVFTTALVLIIIALLYSNFLLAVNYSPLPKVLGTKTQTIGLDIKQKIGDFILYFILDRLSFPSISRVNVPEGITVNGDNIFIGSSFGTTTVNNNLSVQGTSTLSDLSVLGFLDVIGPSTLTTLRVTGNTTLGSSLVLSGFSTSIYNSTPNSSLSLDAGTTGAINIGNSSTGDINLAGGSDHTGCTITNSNGSLNCSSNITTGGNLNVNGGTLTVNVSSSAGIGEIIKAQASQTADLLQFKSSLDAVMAKVDSIGNITGRTLTSTVSTGTAPLTVASTTQVDNLNAQFVSGNTATTLMSQPLPNLVLNSDFSRRNKWMTFMPETFSDGNGTPPLGWTAQTGSLGTVSGNILTAGSSGGWRAIAGLSTWRDGRWSAQFKYLVNEVSTIGSVEKYADANNQIRVYMTNSQFFIGKNIGGSFTQPASTTITPTLNRWYWAELEVQGTTVIGKLYESSSTSPVAKSAATLIATLTATISDAGVTAGQIGIFTTESVQSQWGGLSTGDGGVYVEGWGPESWAPTFYGTLGGQAIGFDESADSGPLSKQWVLRTYIPAASRQLFLLYQGPDGQIDSSATYSPSIYMKVSGKGGSGVLARETAGWQNSTPSTQSTTTLDDASETSWTRKTATKTTESAVRRFYAEIDANPSGTAIGTAFFDLPQIEQGSTVTPWRNAPADDGPIVWNLEVRHGNASSDNPTTTAVISASNEADSGRLALNAFLPWDGKIEMYSNLIVDIIGGAPKFAYGGVAVDGAIPNNLAAASQYIKTMPSGDYGCFCGGPYGDFYAAGKHRLAAVWGVDSGGTIRLYETNPHSTITVVGRRGKGSGNTNANDLAEEYSVNDKTIEGGDVVQISSLQNNPTGSLGLATVEKVSKAYDESILGVVSTDPAITFGNYLNGQVVDNSPDRYTTGTDRRPIALSGRVPVKVTSENGAIKRGDILTSSAAKPGYAMKATKAGRSIGIAMEPFDPAGSQDDSSIHSESDIKTGKILTFVNLSFYDPQVYLADSGQLVISNTTNNTNTANNPIALGDNGLIQNTKYQIQNTTTKEVVERIGAYSNLFVANLKVGSLDVSEINNPLLKDLQLRLTSLELATSSGVLGTTDNLSSSSSATLNTLNVLGRTVLSDLGITGNVSIGTLSIDGATTSINSLSDTLYLQNQLLGGINILNGKILIDKEGNVNTIGILTAKKIQLDQSDTNYKSAGSVIISAGTAETQVSTTALTPHSLIFATPEKPLAVGATKKDDTTILILLKDPAAEDTKINWWIVN